MSLPDVNDLAFVTHSHCETAARRELGMTITVTALDSLPPELPIICAACGSRHSYGEVIAEVVPGLWHPRRWLTKVEPLNEQERRHVQLWDEPATV